MQITETQLFGMMIVIFSYISQQAHIVIYKSVRTNDFKEKASRFKSYGSILNLLNLPDQNFFLSLEGIKEYFSK